MTFSGAISGNGGLIKLGTATETLAGSSTFNGGITIKAGTLSSSNNNGLGSGTVTIGDSANTGLAATLASSVSVSMSNPITTVGNGTITLAGANNAPTFSGNITLGTDLILSTFGQNGNPGGGQFSNLTISGTIGGIGNLTLVEQNTGGNGSNGASIKISNSVNNSGMITNIGNNTGTDTISGNIGGNVTGVIQNSATSMLTLSGNNTYSSGTTVSAGTLKAGVASVAGVSGAFGNNSALTLLNFTGAGIDITGFNTQIGSITGGGTAGGNVTLGAATLTVGGDGTSPAAYAGAIAGTGGVTKIGNGTQIFSGSSSYSGITTISAGILQLGNATAMGTSAVSLLSGATLDVNGNAITNNFTSNATRGTLTNTGSAVSLSSAMVGNASFTVDGSGGITLNGGVGGGSGATVIKNGNNTLTLGGAGDNGFLALTLNAGTVILGKTSTGNAPCTGRHLHHQRRHAAAGRDRRRPDFQRRRHLRHWRDVRTSTR